MFDQNNSLRYFFYSKEQHKMRVQTEKNIGKKFVVGRVLVKGKWMDFTEISMKPDIGKRYADIKLIHSGNIAGSNKVLYTPISSVYETGVR